MAARLLQDKRCITIPKILGGMTIKSFEDLIMFFPEYVPNDRGLEQLIKLHTEKISQGYLNFLNFIGSSIDVKDDVDYKSYAVYGKK